MVRAVTDTRQRLIEMATELVWLSSYGAVSVDEICAKAKVQKGSFYHYFPSKADLALATIDWCKESYKEKYDDIFSATRPPVERFELLAQFMYEKQVKIQEDLGHVCGCPLTTLGSEMAATDERIANKINEIYSSALTYYEAALRDLIIEGLIDKKTDIKTKAEEIYAFIIGSMMMARIQNDLSFIQHHMRSSLMNLVGIKGEQRTRLKLTG